MNLHHARVLKKGHILNIPPSKELPLPTQFDFARPSECAKTVLAMLSTATDHGFRRCVLSYSRETGIASIAGNGVSVLYCPPYQGLLNAEQATRLRRMQVEVPLGTVFPPSRKEYDWHQAVWI